MKKYSLAGKSLVLLSFTLLLQANAYAHSGSITSAAWKACTNKPKSEACEYKGFHDDRYIGTCQSMSAHMICVRNQPIIKAEPKAEIAPDQPEASEKPEAPDTSKASEAPVTTETSTDSPKKTQ